MLRSLLPLLLVVAGCAEQWGDVDVGGDHACGIEESGVAWCWGSNDQGEVGMGDRTLPAPGALPEPARVIGRARWRDVAATAAGTCAIDDEGALWCWGVVGDEAIHPEPARWHDGPWETVTGSYEHWCAIAEDGDMACWGWNTQGQFGRGPPGCSGSDDPDCVSDAELSYPVAPTEPGPWRVVATGTTNTCGIKVDGTLWCAGTNTWGELGSGQTTCNPNQTPCPENPGFFVRTGDRSDWVAVTAGNQNACALDGDGKLWCWGDNRAGALGTGDVELPECHPEEPLDPCSPIPVAVGDDTWREVDLGMSEQVWAIRDDGTLWSWGADEGPPVTSPTEMGLGDDWSAVRSGPGFACGLKTDASMWCWGRNETGALGDGTLVDRPDPVEVQAGP